MHNRVCGRLRVIAATTVHDDRRIAVAIEIQWKKPSPLRTKTSAAVYPTFISQDGPTDPVVYIPRRDRGHRTLRACRVSRSRLGSNRFERYSGMMPAIYSLDHRCGIQNPLKHSKERSRSLFNTENLNPFDEIMRFARSLRE